MVADTTAQPRAMSVRGEASSANVAPRPCLGIAQGQSRMMCKTTATRRAPRGRVIVILVVGWVLAPIRASRADPLRLRADAIADTSSPAGLVVLQGEDRVRPWIDAEALVWAG